jgi:hypothetical protein
MAPDYDLSDLHADQAALWFYLKGDAILGEIFAEQPERRESPLALGAFTQGCSPHCACEAEGGARQSESGSRLIDVSPGNKEVN